MAYDTLKAEIRQYIKTNGANEITGQILQNVLLDMVNAYPSLDGYATQQWVQNQLSDMATQTWVGQQGFVTASALSGYLPLTGGNLNGNLSIYDTMNIYSSSIEWNDDGDYCRITFDDDGITVAAHGTGYVIANEFIKNGGTSSQFLKADGSVDNNTYLSSADLSGYATETWVGNNYLPLTGGNLNGNLSIYGTMNIYASSIEWNDDGDYCRIAFDDDGITVTAHGTGYVIANEFIRNGGTSSQFLKADGSVDSNTYLTTAILNGYATETWVGNNYLPLTGGNLNGNLSIYGTMNIYASSIEWNDDGDYCRIAFDDDGITVTAHGTGYVIANEFIRNGGTSSQFLKADGSVDSNTYLTSSAISDMATQTWVGQQGFLTSSSLSGYATETWVGNNYLPLTGGTLTGELIINNNAQIYNSSSNPYLLFHKPNVNWTRLAMADDGTIEVRSGETGTAFRKFACGRINVDGGSDGYGYISIDSDGINIDGSNTDADQVYLNASLIYCSGDTQIYGDCEAYSFTQSSDIRRKNIVSDLTLSVEDIANAPLFKFTWKDGKDGNVHIGTSAQYWQGLMPELVSENKNGVLGMQYDVAAMAGVTTVAKVVVDHEDRISAIERKLNIN